MFDNNNAGGKTGNLWGLKEEREENKWCPFPCCAFIFRRKKVDVTPPKMGTPVVTVALMSSNDMKYE